MRYDEKGPLQTFKRRYREVMISSDVQDSDSSVIWDYLNSLTSALGRSIKTFQLANPDSKTSLSKTMAVAESLSLIEFDNGQDKGDKDSNKKGSFQDKGKTKDNFRPRGAAQDKVSYAFDDYRQNFRPDPVHDTSNQGNLVPMDVDRARLPRPLDDAAHSECIRKNLCFRCRRPGHYADDCTAFDDHEHTRRGRRPIRNREISTHLDNKGKGRATEDDDNARLVERSKAKPNDSNSIVPTAKAKPEPTRKLDSA
ncbi:hypothetical protein HDU97_009884, partial [Phlyctochytrium planicorne]